jgi:hypothetical protein
MVRALVLSIDGLVVEASLMVAGGHHPGDGIGSLSDLGDYRGKDATDEAKQQHGNSDEPAEWLQECQRDELAGGRVDENTGLRYIGRQLFSLRPAPTANRRAGKLPGWFRVFLGEGPNKDALVDPTGAEKFLEEGDKVCFGWPKKPSFCCPLFFPIFVFRV